MNIVHRNSHNDLIIEKVNKNFGYFDINFVKKNIVKSLIKSILKILHLKNIIQYYKIHKVIKRCVKEKDKQFFSFVFNII